MRGRGRRRHQRRILWWESPAPILLLLTVNSTCLAKCQFPRAPPITYALSGYPAIELPTSRKSLYAGICPRTEPLGVAGGALIINLGRRRVINLARTYLRFCTCAGIGYRDTAHVAAAEFIDLYRAPSVVYVKGPVSAYIKDAPRAPTVDNVQGPT